MGQKPSPSIEGDYAGQLAQFHLLLHIRHDDSANLTGTLDILDQPGLDGVVCESFLLSGVHLSFAFPLAHGTFKGDLSPDGNTITGTWAQQGLSSSLIFIRQTSTGEPGKDAAAMSTFQSDGTSRTYYFAPGQTSSYFDFPIQKLRHAVPELDGIEYDPSQEQLPSILDHVAKTIADLLPRLPDLISREEVYHFQGPPDRSDASLLAGGVFEGSTDTAAASRLSAGQPWSQVFRFLLQRQPMPDGSISISESRLDPQGNAAPDSKMGGHGFAYQWLLFSAANQPGFRFRYLGQQKRDGRKTYVILFMQDPSKVAHPAQFQGQGKLETFYFQGVLWVDQSSFNIVGFRTDLLTPLPDLRRMTTELTFRSVHIHGNDAVFWLPSRVDISTDQGTGPVEEDHQYSDYQLFNAQARIVTSP